LTMEEPDSEDTAELTKWSIKHAVRSVTCEASYEVPAGVAKHHVVLWDFGAKQNIVRKLHALDCRISVVPSNASYLDILKLQPDGIMLSNGPGNPKENKSIIKELKRLCEEKIGKELMVHIGYVGSCVGASVGPGMLGVYFFGKEVTVNKE
ncbi:MAG: hypothetical protein IJ373_04800, partial [Clostridia bacterium]|nr:hypothetical protein [Clostridia bacterium]